MPVLIKVRESRVTPFVWYWINDDGPVSPTFSSEMAAKEWMQVYSYLFDESE
jgi:hypothetical protein